MDPHNSQENFNMEASSVFENLLQKVQKSNLNFRLELSPFSAKISLKKSFIRDKSGIPVVPRSFESYPCSEKLENVPDHDAEKRELQCKIYQLECANAAVATNYQEELLESEHLKSQLNEALDRLDNLQDNFTKADLTLDNLKHQKNQLSMRHEKTYIELKNVKSEVENLKREINQSRGWFTVLHLFRTRF